MPPPRLALLGKIALALIVLIAYLPALQAGYLWDDQDYVVENPNLVHPDGWHRIWFQPQTMVQYYPLVHTVLRLEHGLWQKDPRGYHLVNLLLQAANTVLLYVLLQGLAVPGAWLIAGLFGIHPIQVESVAWITEIKNLLSGLFYLLAAWAYLRFRATRADDNAPRARKAGAADGRRFYAVSLLLFVLALLCKTTVVTLPVALLLVVWWKTGALRRRDLLPLMPMLLLAVGFGALTWWLETHHVGSKNAIALTLAERMLVPARAAWFYVGKLVWPVDLVFIYPRWNIELGAWWQYLFPLGAITALAVLWVRRNRWGRGPLVAVLFYLVTLAPVSGLVRYYFQAFSFVGDHFAYLACIGVLGVAVAPAARWAALSPLPWRRMVARRIAPALLLATLAVLTWIRCTVYRTEELLWRDTVEQNPTAWMAHNNLGVVYMRQGRNAEASARFVEALGLNPDIAEAHSNLGALYQDQGDAERAIAEYRKAVALKPFMYTAQYELAVLLMAHGQSQAAGPHLKEAIRYQPDLADAYPRLGWVLLNQGSFREARDILVRSTQLNPNDATSYELLGLALENLGDIAGAVRQYRRALELDPKAAGAREGMGRLSNGN